MGSQLGGDGYVCRKIYKFYIEKMNKILFAIVVYLKQNRREAFKKNFRRKCVFRV